LHAVIPDPRLLLEAKWLEKENDFVFHQNLPT